MEGAQNNTKTLVSQMLLKQLHLRCTEFLCSESIHVLGNPVNLSTGLLPMTHSLFSRVFWLLMMDLHLLSSLIPSQLFTVCFSGAPANVTRNVLQWVQNCYDVMMHAQRWGGATSTWKGFFLYNTAVLQKGALLESKCCVLPQPESSRSLTLSG